MMLNCIRLTEDYGFDYRVNWFPRNAAAPKLARPGELFSDAYMARHFITNETFEEMRDEALPLHEFFQDKTPDRMLKHMSSGRHVLLEEGFEIAEFRWEDKATIAARYPGFIRKIGLNPLVAQKIAQIDAAVGSDPAGTVAYHVRRGDILNERPWKHGMWPAKIEPDELYLQHLEVAQPKTALVFSDLDECIDRLRAQHSQVCGITGLIDLAGCTPSQRDFLELYAMSRAERIVAPVISAFSSAAARLSGRDRQRFVDVLTPGQIDAAYDRVADRLRAGPQRFVSLSEAAHVFSRLSRHLAMNDREQEGYDIGRGLIAAGADNAFVPLLHAVNCIYLSKWDEAKRHLEAALGSGYLWKEDHAAALALLSHVEGALGDPVASRRLWLRAFWAKPLLPDVIIAGSALLERHRLKSGPDLPFDAEILRAQRLPYINRDTLLVQRKLLKRRPLDLSLLTLEWSALVLDRKAQRLLTDKKRLKHIRARLEEAPPGPGFDSFRGLLQSHLGRQRNALDLTGAAMEQAPDDFLVVKRRAQVLWASNRPARALRLLRRLTRQHPDNPFGCFLYAQCLERDNRPEEALVQYRRAAAQDASTPAIHAALGECLGAQDKIDPAISALATASALAPSFQKFTNQKERFARKIAKGG